MNQAHDMTDEHRQAKAQYETIESLLAAYNCDYGRLNELQEMQTEYTADTWAKECPDEAQELEKLRTEAGEFDNQDEALKAIHNNALSVEYRSGWESDRSDMTPAEVRVVLCTGGPHVEIVADISQGGVSRPRILYRGWGVAGELYDFNTDVVQAYITLMGVAE